MNKSPRDILAGIHAALIEPIDAIVQVSDKLLTEVHDLGQAHFDADLRKIHQAGKKLRQLNHEYLGPESLALGLDASSLTQLQSRVRHDLRNALNPVLNYSELWLEDADEQFLEGFRPDLERIHRLAKDTLALLDRVSTLRAVEATPSEAEAAVVQPVAEGEPADLGRPVEPGYCLVVDDNPDNRDILCRLLTGQGHRVATAADGREAMEKIRAEPFDLILLDILMPVMNGFQVLRALKSDEKLRGIPVVVISALDQDDSVVRCIALGAEDYLPKPFNRLLLQARIGACLEKKRFRDKERQYLQQIEQERKRSDELLRVILPNEIVDELKTTNQVKPRCYDNVAVLFADIVGFTSFCGRAGLEEIVANLQNLVESWENSALEHDVEKIKTIGDAFMACSGLLHATENPVLNCVRCGLKMIQASQSLGIGWDLRVGISVGQVFAGVIGRRQYLFDLWGDTVNTAARMESHGFKGKITLTAEAWRCIAPMATADEAVIEVKGKGPLTVYRLSELLAPTPV